jgi:hypothetical protein
VLRALPLLLLLLAGSCKTPMRVVQRDLPLRSADKLVERVVAHQPHVRWYTAKADVTVATDTSRQNFNAQVRSVSDSALWTSITAVLGIEAARVVLTHDSVKLLDRLHDTYFLGDSAQAKARFGLQPDLRLLQEALMGMPIGFDVKVKYKADREDGQYVLTSRERRRFRRAAEDITETPDSTARRDRDISERRMGRTLEKADEKGAIVFRYWLEPDSFFVTRVQITDLARDQQADVRYVERSTDAHHLPVQIELSLAEPGRSVRGTLVLSKIQLGEPPSISFRIPEKFVPME